MIQTNKKILYLLILIGLSLPIKMFSQSWLIKGSAGFSPASVEYNSIAIDGNGAPWVAYRDNGNLGKATVMKYSNGSWAAQGGAGFSAGNCYYTDLAIDGNNNPWVVYSDATNSFKATVMKLVNGTWTVQGSAGFTSASASHTSIAIDGNGNPWVSYYDGANSGKITVQKLDNGAWTVQGAAAFSAGVAYYTDIAIDGNNDPWVIYSDGGNSYKTTVMKLVSGSWTEQGGAGFSAGDSYFTHLVLDSNDDPWVVYVDGGNSYEATVMKFVSGSWTEQGGAGFTQGGAAFTNIAIDGSNNPWVVYTDGGNSNRASVKKLINGAWVDQGSPGFSNDVATYNSIAIDGNGKPWVVYADGANQDKVTVMSLQSPTTWTGATNRNWSIANNWVSNTVPTSATNVILGGNPIINSTTTCNNLTINTGDTLTINLGGNLTINGNLVVNGYLQMNGGSITFTKPGTCIPAGTYHQLRICAAGTVTACGNITVNHDLVICSGTTFNDGGYVITSKANILNDGTHTSTGNGKIELKGVASTIYGASGIYGNLDINCTSNARIGSSNSTNAPTTINGILNLVSNNLVLNGNILTIGSVSNSIATIQNSGSSAISSTNTSSELRILGNASAPQINNLRINTAGSVTINRLLGVKLGASSSINSILTLTLGTLNMNGFNLSIGSNSTSNGRFLSTGGTINNSGNVGRLSLLGNASNPAYNSIALDTLADFTLNNPNGGAFVKNCAVKNSAILNNGDLNLNGFYFGIGPAANISEANNQNFYGLGYIVTQRTLNSALSNYNVGGMGITLSTNSAPGLTTIVRTHPPHISGGAKSIKRSFGVITTNTVLASFVNIYYDSSELNGNTRSLLRINKSHTGGASWITPNNSVASSANIATGNVYNNSINTNLSSSYTIFTASESTNSLSPIIVNNEPVIDNNEFSSTISTFPNPFTNEFTISLNVTSGLYTILISDINGKNIYNSTIETLNGNNNFNISTESFARGVYIVTILGNETYKTMKVIKQ